MIVKGESRGEALFVPQLVGCGCGVPEVARGFRRQEAKSCTAAGWLAPNALIQGPIHYSLPPTLCTRSFLTSDTSPTPSPTPYTLNPLPVAQRAIFVCVRFFGAAVHCAKDISHSTFHAPFSRLATFLEVRVMRMRCICWTSPSALAPPPGAL